MGYDRGVLARRFRSPLVGVTVGLSRVHPCRHRVRRTAGRGLSTRCHRQPPRPLSAARRTASRATSATCSPARPSRSNSSWPARCCPRQRQRRMLTVTPTTRSQCHPTGLAPWSSRRPEPTRWTRLRHRDRGHHRRLPARASSDGRLRVRLLAPRRRRSGPRRPHARGRRREAPAPFTERCRLMADVIEDNVTSTPSSTVHRRAALKKAALAAGVVAWTTPVVQVLTTGTANAQGVTACSPVLKVTLLETGSGCACVPALEETPLVSCCSGNTVFASFAASTCGSACPGNAIVGAVTHTGGREAWNLQHRSLSRGQMCHTHVFRHHDC